MLYNDERYQDLLDIFSEIRAKKILDKEYPKTLAVIVLAACSKQVIFHIIYDFYGYKF